MGVDGLERVPVAEVTSGMFSLLGLQMALGRPFVSGDDALNAAPIALLGWEAWRLRFGADSAILGQAVVLNQQSFTIVGVLPKGVRLDRTRQPAEYWLPALRDSGDLVERRNRNYRALVRLAPDASFAGATTELTTVLRQSLGDSSSGVRVAQWQHDQSRASRGALLALLAAALVLLGIACVNVAVLLPGESASREREMAARAALGAGRTRLVRQLVVESLVLAFGGALVGSALAWALMRGLVALAPAQLPGLDDVALNWRVLSFAMLAASGTGVLFGIAPALFAGRAAVASLARVGTGQTDRRGVLLQCVLIAGQVALSTVLMVHALLLARSFAALTAVAPGFAMAGKSVARISLPYDLFRDDERARTTASVIQQRVAALPGVREVVLTTSAPFTGSANSSPITVEGVATSEDNPRGQHTQQRYVGAGYLESMSIPLQRGRYFTVGDHADALPVAIISESEVVRDFGDRDPIGLRVVHQGVARTIVGVVADIRYSGLAEPVEPTIYVPFAQYPSTSFALVLRHDGPLALETVRRALREAEPFAIVALLLSAVGLYGVGTRAAARRHREVGIRLALGSTQAAITRLMVSDAMRAVLVGLAVGLPITIALRQYVQPLLFGVTATDMLSYVVTIAVLGVSTLLASYLPSRRASSDNLASILRGE